MAGHRFCAHGKESCRQEIHEGGQLRQTIHEEGAVRQKNHEGGQVREKMHEGGKYKQSEARTMWRQAWRHGCDDTSRTHVPCIVTTYGTCTSAG